MLLQGRLGLLRRLWRRHHLATCHDQPQTAITPRAERNERQKGGMDAGQAGSFLFLGFAARCSISLFTPARRSRPGHILSLQKMLQDWTHLCRTSSWAARAWAGASQAKRPQVVPTSRRRPLHQTGSPRSLRRHQMTRHWQRPTESNQDRILNPELRAAASARSKETGSLRLGCPYIRQKWGPAWLKISRVGRSLPTVTVEFCSEQAAPPVQVTPDCEAVQFLLSEAELPHCPLVQADDPSPHPPAVTGMPSCAIVSKLHDPSPQTAAIAAVSRMDC